MEGATRHVAQRHPRAGAANPATVDRSLKTIGAIARLAQPGETVLVREGIYRERAVSERGTKDRPSTFQSAPGREVVAHGWETWAR